MNTNQGGNNLYKTEKGYILLYLVNLPYTEVYYMLYMAAIPMTKLWGVKKNTL